MSQKERKFQPKSRSGGGNFDGRGKGRSFDRDGERKGARGGKPSGGFRKKFEGDREERRFDRDERGGGDRPFKKRSFGDRDDRGSGERRGGFGDKPRFQKRDDSSGDRPYGKKPFGDRKPRFDRDGDKPFKKREFGDRPSRDGGDRPFKKREFGDRKPRFDRDGDKPFKKREGGFDRPRREGGFDRPRRSSFDERNEPAVEATPETRKKLKSERSGYGAPSSAFLFGVHAVTQALKNPNRTHQRLLCTQRGYESIEKAYTEANDEGMKMPEVIYVEKEDIERLLPRDAVHQDLLLDCQPLEEVFLADILTTADENAKVLILDQVTDPHNVGAIMRSASAFGALAVIAQKLHAPEITGTLAKSASGAVEHIPLVREVNLSRSLEQLKEAGFFCIGLAEEGKRTLAEMKLSGKIALVMGAEGDGLRRLVAENCDELAKLPTQGEIGSLNVSNAAAVALYELTRK